MLARTQKMVGIGLIFITLGLPQIYQTIPSGNVSQNYSAINQMDPFLVGNFGIPGQSFPLQTIGGNTLVAINVPYAPEKPKKIITRQVIITAYSSTPWQTDDSPLITASGTIVRDGIIAANFLPFGAKVRFPELYGDREFVVEDRMNKRYWYHADIWMPSYWEARNFGAKYTEAIIEI